MKYKFLDGWIYSFCVVIIFIGGCSSKEDRLRIQFEEFEHRKDQAYDIYYSGSILEAREALTSVIDWIERIQYNKPLDREYRIPLFQSLAILRCRLEFIDSVVEVRNPNFDRAIRDMRKAGNHYNQMSDLEIESSLLLLMKADFGDRPWLDSLSP